MSKAKHAKPRKKTGAGVLLLLAFLICLVIGALFIHRNTAELAPGQRDREGTALGAQGGKTMLAPYRESYAPFSGEFSAADVARQGDRLLFLGRGASGDVLALAGYSLTDSGRIEVSEAEPVSLDAPGDLNEAAVYDISAGGDGAFYVLTGSAPEDGPGELAVLRYSPDGTFQEKMTVSAFPEDRAGLSLCAGKDGELVLLGIDYVYFLPWQGTPTNRQLSFTGAVSTKDGLVLSVHNYLLDASPFYRIEPQSGNMSRLDITNPVDPSVDVAGFKLVWGGSEAPCQGLDGEYISNSGESFVEFDFANDSYRELFRWNTSNALAGPACRLGESAFICVEPGSGSLLLTGLEEVPYVEKSVVQVAVVGLNGDAHIPEMNEKLQNYDYQVTRYEPGEEDRFLTELISGKPFDLVLFNDGVNTSSDYFADLYPFLDGDADLSRDSFLPNLLESTSVHGQLHQLWDQTAVTTLAGKRSYVGDGEGLTTSDYLRMVEENDQILAVFDTFMSGESLLAHAANVGVSAFVDKENAVCSFDSESFSDLLMWCKEMGPGTAEGSGGPVYEPDEYILSPALITAPIAESAGDQVSYVGFPNGGTGYHFYSPFYGFGLTMAIPANSQNKDGAWAFIKERLSTDTQLNLGEISALPVNMEALKRLAEASSTEAGREELYGLLEKTKYAETFSDEPLREIIVESGQSYLNGGKSLEETVRLIQSKASIYVAEQYG